MKLILICGLLAFILNELIKADWNRDRKNIYAGISIILIIGIFIGFGYELLKH